MKPVMNQIQQSQRRNETSVYWVSALRQTLAIVLTCLFAGKVWADPNVYIKGSVNGTQFLMNWNGRGDLQASPNPDGPWMTISNVAAYTGTAAQTPVGSKRFFRVIDGIRPSPVEPSPVIKPLPKIASANLQLLQTPTAAGGTKLTVTFASGQTGQSANLSNYFVFDDTVYMLRDDGVPPDSQSRDGVYSVIVPFNANDMDEWNQHVAQIPENKRLEPVFDGRTIVGSNTLAAFETEKFKAFLPIPFLPFPCRLGSSTFYDFRKTLIITNLSVVEDPTRTFDPSTGLGTKMSAWTFGNVMTNMANQAVSGINPSDFVRNWLRLWEFNQTVNFDVVPNRQVQMINVVISNWLAASGGVSLDLGIAPFRLLAIVNRVDLRDNTFPFDDAGECRLVFGLVDPSNPAAAPRFTVILEYGVPKTGCKGVRGWAGQWGALNAMPFGAAYNAALQAITDQVTLAGADPSKINQSAINQIRANEIALASPWELREFVLGAAGFMVEGAVTRTPDIIHNNTPLFTSYANDPAFIPGILAGAPVTPLLYTGIPFLGAHAETPGGMFWNGTPAGSIVTPNVRRLISLNTCNGCHAGETQTGFTHINPRSAGAPSGLSGFLTGIIVPDPAGIEPPVSYNDILRRTQDLDALIHKSCLCFSLYSPLRMSH